MEHLRYPNESTEYRAARDALLNDEVALRAQIETVAAKRRALPPGGKVSEDDVFERLFRDLLPLLNSGRIVLPRNDRLQGQIVGLERRTSAVGRDTISHPDRGHDDVANAVAGAAALSKFGGYDTSLRWVSGDDDSGAAWQRVRLQAFINSGGRIRL